MPEIHYRENPTDEEVKRKFESKDSSKFFDPCQDAADRSLKCLRRNLGDREMCTDYFQAYRDCKKQWVRIYTNHYPPQVELRFRIIVNRDRIPMTAKLTRVTCIQIEERKSDRWKKTIGSLGFGSNEQSPPNPAPAAADADKSS
ncbi:hypothetical protein DRE_04544 [Drechslerella stenobrocha 248]|uniref:CHCH domain-containing protein n=1 Tax=Drechslerella stenobrocha 248 TaxID=1043628 RepID=W7HPV2_9PEZI|nr:hypothetical protein DRE_04544 [Drechslerella stenobrocha 248]